MSATETTPTGPVWLREGGQYAPDARNLRENRARIAPKRKATQQSADEEKTRENQNMGEIDEARKAKAELEGFFGVGADELPKMFGSFTMADGTVVVPHEGVKFDKGKLRFDLLPPEVENAIAQILTDGAVKYGERNWELGMAWSRPYAALRRHLIAWWSGQDTDPESGHPHLWHVLTNAAFLVAYEQRGIGEDDRP